MSDERMTIEERRKYLKQMQRRYHSASRGEKGKLLDEREAVTGQHRKGLIRLMKGSLERRPRQRQRGKRYGALAGVEHGPVQRGDRGGSALCAEPGQ